MTVIPRIVPHCTFCGCELTGGLDTFGPLDQPMCRHCWTEIDEAGGADFIPWREAFAADYWDPDDSHP